MAPVGSRPGGWVRLLWRGHTASLGGRAPASGEALWRGTGRHQPPAGEQGSGRVLGPPRRGPLHQPRGGLRGAKHRRGRQRLGNLVQGWVLRVGQHVVPPPALAFRVRTSRSLVMPASRSLPARLETRTKESNV